MQIKLSHPANYVTSTRSVPTPPQFAAATDEPKEIAWRPEETKFSEVSVQDVRAAVLPSPSPWREALNNAGNLALTIAGTASLAVGIGAVFSLLSRVSLTELNPLTIAGTVLVIGAPTVLGVKAVLNSLHPEGQ